MSLILLNINLTIGEIIAIASAILIAFCGFYFKRWRIIRNTYSAVWKSSKRVKPDEVLGNRALLEHGFHKYYHRRKIIDEAIEKAIKNKKNILVVGNPLSGKSRSVYQYFHDSEDTYSVLIPKVADVSTKDFRKPLNWLFRRKKIVLFDDIDKYMAKTNFEYLLSEYVRSNDDNGIVIATCRGGKNLNCLGEKISSYFDEVIEIPRFDKDSAKQVAKSTGRKLPNWYDGNIGTIFLDLKEMATRYDKKLTPEERNILIAIKCLYSGGVYQSKEVFSLSRIIKVSEEMLGMKKQKYQYVDMFNKLKENGFILYKDDYIWAEETYLKEFIIQDIDQLDNLNKLYGIFNDDPDVLFYIGVQADELGQYDLRICEYMNLAINVYTKVLKYWTFNYNKFKYASVQNNLGVVYRKLSDIENKEKNNKNAIECHKEVIKIFTIKHYSLDYAMAQNNLGVAYGALSERVDKVYNCKLAINSFKESLKIYTLSNYPLNYAMVKNNIGNAYRILCEEKDKILNSELAIEAYKEALRIYKYEQFPMNYAITNNNLGNAYRNLSEEKDKSYNCDLALMAFKESLRTRTIERFPILFAYTQHNVGLVYWTLAESFNKEVNCGKARYHFNLALEVYTKQNILGLIKQEKLSLTELQLFCEEK